ncbi:Hypothetical predicted protein [Podarcis lilfordi]|uniref:Uncharacterized protein n=1 Tax=Podarcis lilfordi TaxID=74358 RepID=A0AA35JS93_9SAUR|nr:Hypothetical predicted protein [Podarcis lilfordi]
MTQGKLSVNNKPANSEGQQADADKKDNTNVPSAPPTYEEATSAEGLKSGAFPPPLNVPLHPAWAYVDPSEFVLSLTYTYIQNLECNPMNLIKLTFE